MILNIIGLTKLNKVVIDLKIQSRGLNIEQLELARKRKGYSYRDMAELLGFKRSASYYNIIIGKTPLKVEKIKILAKTLDLPIKKILQ